MQYILWASFFLFNFFNDYYNHVSNVSTCKYRYGSVSFSLVVLHRAQLKFYKKKDFSFIFSLLSIQLFYRLFISWQGGWHSLRYNLDNCDCKVAPHTKTLKVWFSLLAVDSFKRWWWFFFHYCTWKMLDLWFM